MSKRILYVTTIGETMSFFTSLIGKLISDGNVVDIACNDEADDVPKELKDIGCQVFHIDTSRSPLKKGNITAIKQLRKIVSDGKYDIVHCHTPIAAACTRIACRKFRKNGTKVFYTAHGFHFYKGAPVKNWLIFYPVEKMCAHFTDVLITINGQDYNRAKKKLKAKNVEYVPGVGIDVCKFKNADTDVNQKRQETGVPSDAFLILSVGELNDNKNHESVIKALNNNDLVQKMNIHYAIAGVGDGEEHLKSVAKECNLEDRVHLLGFRRDVSELFKCSDLFIHPSFREGLPVAVMEAMASGIVVCGSNIRGCQDLIDDDLLFNPKDINSIKNELNSIVSNMEAYRNKSNDDKINQFDISYINKKMYELYGL